MTQICEVLFPLIFLKDVGFAIQLVKSGKLEHNFNYLTLGEREIRFLC